MLTNRRLVLSCLLFALTACGGRSGLDDFSKGADNIVTGSTSGSSNGNAGNNGDDTSDGGSDQGGSNSTDNNGSNGNSQGGGSGDAPVGSACEKDSTCEGTDAECLTEVSIGGFFMLDFPDGYCAVQGCEDDGDCPDGSGCLNALGVQACLQTCERERDCRANDGYACTSIGGGGGGGFPGGGGQGGMEGPSYCLPPFNMGGQGGGFPGQTGN